MTYQVELFRSDDYGDPEHLPLAPLLREVFEAILQRPLPPPAQFLLNLLAVDDTEPLPGLPTLVNLRGSHGYANVYIIEQGIVIYQHPHTVREIIAEPLQRRLRLEHPDVAHWGFGLVGPGLETLAMIRPTPAVEGRVDIRSDGRRRRAAQVEELPDPEPPPNTLAGLRVADPGHPRGGPSGDPDAEPVAVVLSPEANATLTGHEFSQEVEEGGFVIGHRHLDGDHPGRHLLEVTDVVPAQSTGASMLRFTFTGESFLQLSNLIALRGRDEHILGWYHTHLFAATPDFGLSTVDVRLHTSTFRRKWQVAALLNLGHDGRVLRFYRLDRKHLTEAPFWVAEPAAVVDGASSLSESPAGVTEP
jgi:proteasome lid subunit RPN8/RPN11